MHRRKHKPAEASEGTAEPELEPGLPGATFAEPACSGRSRASGAACHMSDGAAALPSPGSGA